MCIGDSDGDTACGTGGSESSASVLLNQDTESRNMTGQSKTVDMSSESFSKVPLNRTTDVDCDVEMKKAIHQSEIVDLPIVQVVDDSESDQTKAVDTPIVPVVQTCGNYSDISDVDNDGDIEDGEGVMDISQRSIHVPVLQLADSDIEDGEPVLSFEKYSNISDAGSVDGRKDENSGMDTSQRSIHVPDLQIAESVIQKDQSRDGDDSKDDNRETDISQRSIDFPALQIADSVLQQGDHKSIGNRKIEDEELEVNSQSIVDTVPQTADWVDQCNDEYQDIDHEEMEIGERSVIVSPLHHNEFLLQRTGSMSEAKKDLHQTGFDSISDGGTVFDENSTKVDKSKTVITVVLETVSPDSDIEKDNQLEFADSASAVEKNNQLELNSTLEVAALVPQTDKQMFYTDRDESNCSQQSKTFIASSGEKSNNKQVITRSSSSLCSSSGEPADVVNVGDEKIDGSGINSTQEFENTAIPSSQENNSDQICSGSPSFLGLASDQLSTCKDVSDLNQQLQSDVVQSSEMEKIDDSSTNGLLEKNSTSASLLTTDENPALSHSELTDGDSSKPAFDGFCDIEPGVHIPNLVTYSGSGLEHQTVSEVESRNSSLNIGNVAEDSIEQLDTISDGVGEITGDKHCDISCVGNRQKSMDTNNQLDAVPDNCVQGDIDRQCTPISVDSIQLKVNNQRIIDTHSEKELEVIEVNSSFDCSFNSLIDTAVKSENKEDNTSVICIDSDSESDGQSDLCSDFGFDGKGFEKTIGGISDTDLEWSIQAEYDFRNIDSSNKTIRDQKVPEFIDCESIDIDLLKSLVSKSPTCQRFIQSGNLSVFEDKNHDLTPCSQTAIVDDQTIDTSSIHLINVDTDLDGRDMKHSSVSIVNQFEKTCSSNTTTMDIPDSTCLSTMVDQSCVSSLTTQNIDHGSNSIDNDGSFTDVSSRRPIGLDAEKSILDNSSNPIDSTNIVQNDFGSQFTRENISLENDSEVMEHGLNDSSLPENGIPNETAENVKVLSPEEESNRSLETKLTWKNKSEDIDSIVMETGLSNSNTPESEVITELADGGTGTTVDIAKRCLLPNVQSENSLVKKSILTDIIVSSPTIQIDNSQTDVLLPVTMNIELNMDLSENQIPQNMEMDLEVKSESSPDENNSELLFLIFRFLCFILLLYF